MAYTAQISHSVVCRTAEISRQLHSMPPSLQHPYMLREKRHGAAYGCHIQDFHGFIPLFTNMEHLPAQSGIEKLPAWLSANINIFIPLCHFPRRNPYISPCFPYILHNHGPCSDYAAPADAQVITYNCSRPDPGAVPHLHASRQMGAHS